MYHCDHEKLPLLKLLSSSQTIRNDRIKINNRTTYFVNSRLNSNSVLGRYHRVYFLTNVFLMLILSIFHIELVLANNKVEDASISNKNYKERKMLQQDHRRNTNRYKLNNNEMHELMITPQNHDDISSSTTNNSNNINDDYMINSNTTNNLINSNMNDDNEQIIMNYYNEWMISPKIVGGNPIPQGTYPYYAFSAGNKVSTEIIFFAFLFCFVFWMKESKKVENVKAHGLYFLFLFSQETESLYITFIICLFNYVFVYIYVHSYVAVH